MARAKRRRVTKSSKKVSQVQKPSVLSSKSVTQLPKTLFIVTFTIIIALILSLIFKQKTNTDQAMQLSPTQSMQEQVNDTGSAAQSGNKQEQIRIGSSYTVQKGDTLWSIAERAYGSGFNAYDIAKRNNLDNPGAIEVGQRLIMPNTQAKLPTQGEITSGVSTTAPSQSGSTSPRSYTIVRGDCLWTIAEKRYNDGYRWSDIARENQLENPRLIHAGNTLILP